MGQQASVGAAGDAALDRRGGVRGVGKLALAVAAGAVVGAGLYAVVDRVVDDAAVEQVEAVVAVDGNREAAAELAREKAALLAAGAGAVEVDSAADAANVLARDKAALASGGGGVLLDVDSAADVANALARDGAGVSVARVDSVEDAANLLAREKAALGADAQGVDQARADAANQFRRSGG